MPKPYRFNDLIDQCPTHCQDPVDILEPPSAARMEELAQLIEDRLLSPMFSFVMGGRRLSVTSQAKDTTGMRVWAVLYVVAPSHLRGETIVACARRYGVASAQIDRLIAEFRAEIAARMQPKSFVKTQVGATPPTPR